MLDVLTDRGLAEFDKFCFFLCEKRVKYAEQVLQGCRIVASGPDAETTGRDDPVVHDRWWRVRAGLEDVDLVDGVLAHPELMPDKTLVFPFRQGRSTDASMLLVWDIDALVDAWFCVAGSEFGDGPAMKFTLARFAGVLELWTGKENKHGLCPLTYAGSRIIRVFFKQRPFSKCIVGGISHLCPKDMYHKNETEEPLPGEEWIRHPK